MVPTCAAMATNTKSYFSVCIEIDTIQLIIRNVIQEANYVIYSMGGKRSSVRYLYQNTLNCVIECGGLQIKTSFPCDKDNTCQSIKNRSVSVGWQMKAQVSPKTIRQIKYCDLFRKIPVVTSEKSKRILV